MSLARALVGALMFIMAAATSSSCWAGNLRLLVILSDDSAPYQSFAKALNKSLNPSIEVSILEHPELPPPNLSAADLTVTVGMKATEFVFARTGSPVLAVMVPKVGYDELLAKTSKQNAARAISAIYLDQPLSRQFDFLKAALPERRRIGLLYSPDTRIDVARLLHNVAKRDGLLVARPVLSSEKLFASLESVLSDSDVLLAIPDSAIYNSSNIRNILLTSYRRGVPLVGLSLAYVNAGALCAIFSTPEQLAEQTSSTAMLFARTRQLSGSQYPAAFTIEVNRQVARSLDIELPSTEAIRSQMDKTEE